MSNENIKNNKGFTLLFAVLVSVLILAVGASMITIALKQLILSSAGRESQFAFYAANTGIECALYWDLKLKTEDDNSITYTFPYTTGGLQSQRSDISNLRCAGGKILDGTDFDGGTYTQSSNYSMTPGSNSYTFRIAITNSESGTPDFSTLNYCSEITVTKEDAGNSLIKTTITSRGLNTCDPDGNSRAVERALVLEYVS